MNITRTIRTIPFSKVYLLLTFAFVIITQSCIRSNASESSVSNAGDSVINEIVMTVDGTPITSYDILYHGAFVKKIADKNEQTVSNAALVDEIKNMMQFRIMILREAEKRKIELSKNIDTYLDNFKIKMDELGFTEDEIEELLPIAKTQIEIDLKTEKLLSLIKVSTPEASLDEVYEMIPETDSADLGAIKAKITEKKQVFKILTYIQNLQKTYHVQMVR